MALAEYVYCSKLMILHLFVILLSSKCSANDILGCGGFIKSHVKLDFSEIEIGLYTKEGSLKEKTECAPTNGYYFLPLYEKGDYILKVHPPAGLSFEPSEVALSVDGVTDRCSTGQDINFEFNGFGINGRVITVGQQQGPSGIAVQLVNEEGETRNTVTTIGGDFHFTAVIPGKYTVKASHPRWKLEPSEVEVQMKEGKMALPVGVVLAVKGYDVKGSITSFGSPIEGVYVLLYSKEENPKYRVEGCNTALLQGVPDSPICHVTTDTRGEFLFGLVPAGEYKLIALSTSPGQVELSYNVKPDAVPFTVQHDSLYIKNAFEVTGFTIVGTVESTSGAGLPGARVLLDGTPVGTSDAVGKFTLAGLKPGVYTVSFEHEQCQVEPVHVSVGEGGLRGGVRARAGKWRVCGDVTPPARRNVLLRGQGGEAVLAVADPHTGEWCTFLPPGAYTAQVEVSEQEQSEGVQYYPASQQVPVPHGASARVRFSQLKARVRGRVVCGPGAPCRALRVALRDLRDPGAPPRYADVHEGTYAFSEVVPGAVEVWVPEARLCWARARHAVSARAADTRAPDFLLAGYVLRLHADHDLEVEYRSATSQGVWSVPRGASRQCVPTADRYTVTPRGCHRFQPAEIVVDTTAEDLPTVYLVAVAHAVVVKVTSPDPVDDLVLTIDTDGKGSEKVGPLKPKQEGGMFVFEHTLYMADGEVAAVSWRSSSLVFQPSGPAQVVGAGACQPDALTVRGRRALTLQGRTVPPVAGATVTLSSEDGEQSQLTSAEGRYRFGPLDARRTYSVSAHKDSYVFSAPDPSGDIRAHKLAEIIVELVDDADGKPLEGALVSVSGGTYRRSAQARGGALRFGSLSPGEYYVKPNMKEYRFSPQHKLLDVHEGRTHALTLRGVRVAWSCLGELVSVGGRGWAGAVVSAVPLGPRGGACVAQEATTEASGGFRIRGLVPDCEYSITLKEPTTPELAGLRLALPPPVIKVRGGRDVTGVRLVGAAPGALTDAQAAVSAPPDLYRTLRVSLAAAHAPRAALYAARLDGAGYGPGNNPGLMYVLPRLPADNKSYVLSLESSLSRATHTYPDLAYTFISDGGFKYFHFEFDPKVKSSEQELRQSSFLLIPLLGILGFLYTQRGRLLNAWPRMRTPRPTRQVARPDVLDKASIDQILNTVNAAGKKTPKKKAL